MSELHIGHYALGRTIGTGGFAKVKGGCMVSQKVDTIKPESG